MIEHFNDRRREHALEASVTVPPAPALALPVPASPSPAAEAAKKHRGPYGGYHANRVPAHDPELTKSGPGNARGEYMGSCWQPLCMSMGRSDTPRFVKSAAYELHYCAETKAHVALVDDLEVAGARFSFHGGDRHNGLTSRASWSNAPRRARLFLRAGMAACAAATGSLTEGERRTPSTSLSQPQRRAPRPSAARSRLRSRTPASALRSARSKASSTS